MLLLPSTHGAKSCLDKIIYFKEFFLFVSSVVDPYTYQLPFNSKFIEWETKNLFNCTEAEIDSAYIDVPYFFISANILFITENAKS